MVNPLPSPAVGDEVEWVREHLGHLALEPAQDIRASARFRGGQPAADAALAGYDVTGYAGSRNEVLPVQGRGASELSPYIRHGLITLPAAWAHVAGAPSRDRTRFRDQLLWQEYARHLYARVGSANRSALRREPARGSGWTGEPWPREMACMDLVVDGLETDGWLVNQTRLWAASQWTVRAGQEWTAGEDRFFAHLLDGSRAANRLGWQWAVGAGTGKPYGFSRWQVEKRAPVLCRGCALRDRCPVQDWPDAEPGTAVDEPPGLRQLPAGVAGPASVETTGQPAVVWLTAESLGDDDPALTAHPELPAVFVFDEPLLTRLRLSGKRLVYLAECLAELGALREVRVALGDPVAELVGTRVATTYAPVPGWAARAKRIEPVVVHPWPWLVRPRGGSVTSYSAWIRTHHR
ncbi:MAG: deoxyribodipyrimidine photolyase [Geodermatophilaceae bacterium]|nr:deoxyribodipyrimidine photolyase [Geodermatophilaceae bacterium]